MASSVQGMRTFGDKPKAFQLEEGGELYYVGSEVYPVSEISNVVSLFSCRSQFTAVDKGGAGYSEIGGPNIEAPRGWFGEGVSPYQWGRGLCSQKIFQFSASE